MSYPMFPLIQKELRSAAWVVGLGLFAYVWLLAEMSGYSQIIGRWNQSHQRLALGVIWFGFVTAGFAGLLGLVMASDDSLRGTWQFVLFRPISRRRYIVTKLLTGAVLVVLTPLVPVTLFLEWEYGSGRLGVPWDVTAWQIPAEAIGWSVPIFLSGFLSSIRVASWWWSRLWPLVTTCVLGMWFWLACLEESFPDALTPSPIQFWGLCVLVSAALVVLIFDEMERREFS
ncbi:MAG: hypothetical protein IAG10_28015 [Planctomycetaceae bacterium]|nr:hypothetical protein [Planctomycetaceae bacterium]